MCAQANNNQLQLGVRGAAQESVEDVPGLELNVVFATEQGTVAALLAAGNLARQLNAGVRLLVTQVAPYTLPIDRPKVAVEFIHGRCRNMALECTGVTEVRVNVYLCRNRSQALRRALSPNSLVIMGGRRCWWCTAEHKLAKMLEADGHQVIFADLSPDRRPAKTTSGEDARQGAPPNDTQAKVAYKGSVSTTAQRPKW
jgi:hypothetical protein